MQEGAKYPGGSRVSGCNTFHLFICQIMQLVHIRDYMQYFGAIVLSTVPSKVFVFYKDF